MEQRDLDEVLGEAGEVLPQVGVEALRDELARRLLGGGGGHALVQAQARAHGEAARVRRARVAHQLVSRRAQPVLLAQLLQQRHVAARVQRRRRPAGSRRARLLR